MPNIVQSVFHLICQAICGEKKQTKFESKFTDLLRESVAGFFLLFVSSFCCILRLLCISSYCYHALVK